MTDDTAIDSGNAPFKNQMTRWLFSQAASTILLFAIAFGVYRGLPYIMDRVDAIVTRQEAAQKEARNDFKEIISEQGKTIDKVGEALDKNTECLRELKSAIK